VSGKLQELHTKVQRAASLATPDIVFYLCSQLLLYCRY